MSGSPPCASAGTEGCPIDHQATRSLADGNPHRSPLRRAEHRRPPPAGDLRPRRRPRPPDPEPSLAILSALPAAGADVLELGMPFTDPMADGPAIQLSSQRALKAGQTLEKTLGMVREFRKGDDRTPIVLMGYYNPIYVYG